MLSLTKAQMHFCVEAYRRQLTGKPHSTAPYILRKKSQTFPEKKPAADKLKHTCCAFDVYQLWTKVCCNHLEKEGFLMSSDDDQWTGCDALMLTQWWHSSNHPPRLMYDSLAPLLCLSLRREHSARSISSSAIWAQTAAPDG